MNRIILTDNAIRVVNEAYVERLIDASALREITIRIRELPDGLVRCQYCKWWKKYINGNDWGLCEKHDIDHPCNGDWFCADGERRTE